MSGFKAWLRTQARREDAVGDLSRDAIQDRCWPRGGASLRRLEEHLEEHGAIEEANQATSFEAIFATGMTDRQFGVEGGR